MTIGVCYFPEHWPRERWATDVQQMAAAGIEYVRMAEFSWGRLEPERGTFDFEWLDEALDLIGEHGMEAVLCTPTATPPKWLVDDHPDVRQADPDGTPREWGSRRFTCFSSPTYREESERIVRTLADRYADHPHVAGWQIDNEYGCHETVQCYCEDCAAGFREWCRERYGDVDALNEAWGTTFWSQQYPDFAAIDPPGPTPAEHHPSRLLDYARFANDAVVAYNRLQTAILREANDDWFLTHNFMGDFDTMDAQAVGEDLDVLAWDSYPTGFVQDRRPGAASVDELRAGDPHEVGMNHDLYRGVKRAPFWVMEQQPGDVNWPPHAPQPGEGAMRLWAHHAVAHGADAVLYFRWRRCREGQEQYHAGLRKADGSPDRGYHDATRSAEDLADELADVAPVDAPVALLHDYDNLWATSVQPHSPDWEYWHHHRAYYATLRRRGVQVDLVAPDGPLDEYAAVVAPTLHLVDDALASHLTDYVEGGGHLLFGARTGLKDPHGKLHDAPAPGPLASLVGATVDQHESLPESVPTRLAYDGDEYDYRTWAEWLTPRDATETVAKYTSGVGDGHPAVTRRTLDEGSVTYCGCWPGAALADELAVDLLAAADVAHTDRLPEGVDVAERDGYAWVTNFTGDAVTVDVAGGGEWVVGGADVEPYGVGVVAAPAASVSVETADG